ncbi:MAG: phospholipid carrier-dependent glycosyltransferase, partial [Actinomycetota bacterium]
MSPDVSSECRAPAGPRQWSPADLVIVLLLIAVAALLRFPRLSEPAVLVFDETYYAKDACLYLGRGQGVCDAPQATEQSWVHPPLGKWIIAAGERAFGYDAFGWRVMAALFGTGLVPVVFLLARTLFSDRWVATVAGLLTATDFLLLVQSRLGMLDIFLAFFVALGFLFLGLARDRARGGLATEKNPFGEAHAPGPERGWRLACGAALGAAMAVKWSAAWALGGAGLLALGWAIGQARAEHAGPRELGAKLAGLGLAFGLVPLAVYLAAYLPWLVDHRFDLEEFVRLQRGMANYHLTLQATHTYQSRAWTWPLVLRPVAYHYVADPKVSHVLAFGNPAVWWASIGAGVWLAVRSLRGGRGERVVAMGWASQYLPWLVVARPLFTFYMTPVVPFMMV